MTILSPLKYNVPIVEKDGTPTREFLQKWNAQAKINGTIPDLNTAAEVSALLDLLGGANNDYLQRASGLWAPKTPPGDATKFLNGAGPGAWAQVKGSDLSMADVVNNNVTSTAHGFAPKAPADATTFLNGGASPAYAQVKDSDLSTSNITTNNVTTAKHGFAPILPNDATKFLNGVGAYAVPAGSGGSGGKLSFPLVAGSLSAGTALFATVGVLWTATEAFSISGLWALAAPASGKSYMGVVCKLSGVATGATISSIQSSSVFTNGAATARRWLHFVFGTPLAISIGDVFAGALVRTSDTATTANGLNFMSAGADAPIPAIDAGSLTLASVAPANGNAITVTAPPSLNVVGYDWS